MRYLCLLIAAVALLSAGEAQARRHRKVRNMGRLPGGMRLPAAGQGYFMPPTWAGRGLTWGTPRLISLIEHAAARVSEELPGAMLYVGDLSKPGGGPTGFHRSHQTGRDV